MLCNIDDELCTYAQSGKQLQYKQQKQYGIVVNIIFVIDESEDGDLSTQHRRKCGLSHILHSNCVFLPELLMSIPGQIDASTLVLNFLKYLFESFAVFQKSD
uniref:Uncharacterized protein n=1 Tax=Glossina austeni TaxID=7395 RepID=A0A1A9VFF6_GLOAU